MWLIDRIKCFFGVHSYCLEIPGHYWTNYECQICKKIIEHTQDDFYSGDVKVQSSVPSAIKEDKQ